MSRLVCEFVFEGAAVGKGRPRITVRGGHGHAYTPKRTVDFERAINAEAALAVKRDGPMATDEAVDLSVTVFRAVPKSYSKARRAALQGQPITVGGDIDNVVKSIADAMNGVAYLDDKQVSDLRARRRWGIADEIVVRVTTVGADE